MKTEIFRFHDQTELSLFPYPEILITLFSSSINKMNLVVGINVRNNSIFSYDRVNGSFRDENDVMFSNKKSKSNKNSKKR